MSGVGGRNSEGSMFKKIGRVYGKAQKWIIYGLIVFLLVVFCLGDIVGDYRDRLLVPAALATLAMLFQMLIAISNSLSVRPERNLFPSIYDALPKIKEIVGRPRKVTSVKVIAGTGGTTIAALLPTITSSSQAREVDISIGILSPDSEYRAWVPDHWPSESRTSIKRLKEEFGGGRITVSLVLFEILPVPHGLLIDNEHLFIGFFSWLRTDGKSQLSGAQLPHRYYHARDPEFAYYSTLFQQWFENCPQTRLDKRRMFIFDFDGTLVDSYKCLRDVYTCMAERVGLVGGAVGRLVDGMVGGEDEQDALRNYDRHKWWPMVLKQFNIGISEENLAELVGAYWNERAERSEIIGGGKEILESLKGRGVLAIVCGGDGRYGNKKDRIQRSGLAVLFDEIVVVGEDVENSAEAVGLLMRKYFIPENEVMLFDDKPFVINEVRKNMQDVATVKVDFEGILKLAWREECVPTYRIGGIGDAKAVIGAQESQGFSNSVGGR